MLLREDMLKYVNYILIDHGTNVDVTDKVRDYTTHDHNCYIVSHLV